MARRSGDPQRAFIYARISLDRTGAGLGVDRQIEDCKSLVAARGWVLADVFHDNDISAYSGRPRPSYKRMLSLIRSGGVDVVVAWHTDRLHRSPRELEEWIDVCEQQGVTTMTVRAGELDLSTAAGRMVARMLGAAARHESEQKSERVSRARQQSAEAGRAHGPLGFGYNADQTINTDEARVVRDVARRLLSGETLYSIASDLNRQDVPTPGAGVWTWRTIGRTAKDEVFGRRLPPKVRTEIRRRLSEGEAAGRIGGDLTRRGIPAPTGGWRSANLRQMIRRGSLCGYREWEPGARGRGRGDLVAKGNWSPILRREDTEQLRKMLDSPERATGRRIKHELSGILVCGKCKARMSGRLDKRTNTRKYSCCAQPGLDRCGGTSIVAEPVEALVEAVVLNVLTNSQLRQNRHAAMSDSSTVAELSAAREARDLLVRQLARGELSTAEWAAARPLLDARVRRAEAILSSESVHSATLMSIPGRGQVQSWWNSASVERKHAVIAALIEQVVIGPAARGRNTFDATRVGTPIWRA